RLARIAVPEEHVHLLRGHRADRRLEIGGAGGVGVAPHQRKPERLGGGGEALAESVVPRFGRVEHADPTRRGVLACADEGSNAATRNTDARGRGGGLPPPSASASSCFFIDLGETIARRATRRERSARRSLAVLFRASSTSGPSVSPSSEGERLSTKSSSGRLAFEAQRRRGSPPP